MYSEQKGEVIFIAKLNCHQITVNFHHNCPKYGTSLKHITSLVPDISSLFLVYFPFNCQSVAKAERTIP